MRLYQVAAQLNYVLSFVFNLLTIVFAVGAVRAVYALGEYLKSKVR